MTSIGFVNGTKVLTPSGPVPIEQVVVESLVLGASNDQDEVVPRRVVAVKRGRAEGVVHTLYGTDSIIEYVIAGWDQKVFAVGAEPWAYGHETPGWVTLGEQPSDVFLRSDSGGGPVRVEQVAFVHRTVSATRGFIAPVSMDQAVGAWLDLSGSEPEAIPHPGRVTSPVIPGLVVNDLDVFDLPTEQRALSCETLSLVLEGDHGYFVGRRKLFVLAQGAGDA